MQTAGGGSDTDSSLLSFSEGAPSIYIIKTL